MDWRRKNNRLPADRYVGNSVYFLTIATEQRSPVFENAELVQACEQALSQSAAVENFELLAYLFMPDHLHVLVQGVDDSILSRFARRFKQTTSYYFKAQTGRKLWQKSYHDHVVRTDEDLIDVALHIAANPVRAGLVREWEAYRFWGGGLLQRAADGDLKVAATSAAEVLAEVLL